MQVKLPLTPEASPRAGTITFRPVVHIEVLRQDGRFGPLRFRVDTGADVTSIPFLVADASGVHITDHDRTERSMYGVGAEPIPAHRGVIHVRIAGSVHRLPCRFIGPFSPPPPSPPGAGSPRRRTPPNLLGRQGFLDIYDVCIDKTHLTIRRPSRFRRWLRRLWRRYWATTFGEREVNRPL
jgi:hypothetical protein